MIAYVVSHWLQEPSSRLMPNAVLYTQSVNPEQSNPYGRMVPELLDPAAVTSRGVFHASFQPGALLPPQKYGTRPTRDSAARISSFRAPLHVRLFKYAFSSVSVIGGTIPLVSVPYMVIFRAFDMFRIASPQVMLNWLYCASVSMPKAVSITDWSKGWIVQTTYLTVFVSGSPPSSSAGTVTCVSFSS